MKPAKLVILDVTNNSSQNIKKIIIEATDGTGEYYSSVTYYNLKQNNKVLLPIVFNRDGSFIVNYIMDNNLTLKSSYPYVMVGDTRKSVVTDKEVFSKGPAQHLTKTWSE